MFATPFATGLAHEPEKQSLVPSLTRHAPATPRAEEGVAATCAEMPAASLAILDARFAAFLDYARLVKNHSAATLNWYRGSYSNFRRYLAAEQLDAAAFGKRLFDLDAWMAWNRARKIEGVTLNSYWRALAAFFGDWQRREGGPNPFAGRRKPKVRSYIAKALSHEDCVRVMLTARNYPWVSEFARALAVAVLGVMLYAGLRLGEVQRLRVEDANLGDGTIRVIRGKGQGGGKDRIAYMAPELVAILREYLQERFRRADGQQPPELFTTEITGRPIGRYTIWYIIRRVKKASGINFSAHVLRHSFVTHLIRSGAPIHVVRDLAGHSSITTTIGYLKVFDEDRRSTLQHLRFGDRSHARS